MIIRPAAVAGGFYPADPDELRRALADAFAGARPPESGAPVPKALVVPHAGYIYSGPVAASAYLRLAAGRDRIRRVMLLGPSHRVALDGIAISAADGMATPLGLVAIARPELPGVVVDDRPHALEHSLEVQLPFLQTVLHDFDVVPLVVGRCPTEAVRAVTDTLWGGDETVVVVSTDLSHYHRYEEAVARDRRTVAAIAALNSSSVGDNDACGAYPLRGFLDASAARQLHATVFDVRNSGDTAGDRERVVGYVAVGVG